MNERAFYVGFKKCGCPVSVIVDDRDVSTLSETADCVADMIRGGLTVERLAELPEAVKTPPLERSGF